MEVSKKEFQQLVKSYVEADPQNRKKLAHHCGVSFPTVDRWCAGKNSPAKPILNRLAQYLKKQLQTGK